jgi:hypothetical protein
MPDFPAMEGRDAEPVKAFLDPVKDLPDGGEDARIRNEDMALMSATAASQLSKDAALRADALAVSGRALRIAADKAGLTARLWPERPVPDISRTPTPAGDGVEGGGGAEVEVGGGDAAEAKPPLMTAEEEERLLPARDTLKMALEAALEAGNVLAAGEAAAALCACIGESDPARAVELLNIWQVSACALASHERVQEGGGERVSAGAHVRPGVKHFLLDMFAGLH